MAEGARRRGGARCPRALAAGGGAPRDLRAGTTTSQDLPHGAQDALVLCVCIVAVCGMMFVM